ncbi:MAG: DUF5658 family protein [Isosphaeraceae bacterium]
MPEAPTRRQRTHSPISAEASLLIVLSMADLILTHRLLQIGGGYYESNPLAQWVFVRWNVLGLTVYKFALVAFVVVIGEYVEHRRPKWGRGVILFGCAAAAYAFLHGLRLWIHHG